VIEAINAGRIPPAFQEGLQARANELVNTVNCPPPEAEDVDEKKSKKDKNKDKEEAPPEELVPLPPTTDGDE